MDNIINNYKSDDEQEKPNTPVKRNIPHIEGNFSTHLYFTVKRTSKLRLVEDSIISIIKENSKVDEIPSYVTGQSKSYHVSLSKNLYLKQHQIYSFTAKIKDSIQTLTGKRSLILLPKIRYLTNDYNSRHFLCLQILKTKALREVVDTINSILEEFKLPIYYEVYSYKFK